MVIDDVAAEGALGGGAAWRLFTDQVMGGVSAGSLTLEVVAGRPALHLRGGVRLENNGGFVQMARDVAHGKAFDASGFEAFELDVFGNGETYGLHLKTADTARPWQSYRQNFTAEPRWQRLRLPLAGFAPHRVEAPFDPSRLRRIGLVAIGRAFYADVALARLALV
ncbi:MAG: CIA30 family protein [Geminicoccaceae bacterium]|nr:MAG: CIA30 family protein [Geminicoccaceae bacterium]